MAGTGYLQKNFNYPCQNAHEHRNITKETLAFRKLAEDLAGSNGLS